MHLQAGETRYNDALEDYSPARFKADLAKCKDYLSKAEAILKNSASSLSDADKLNLRLFKAEVGTFIDGYDSQGYDVVLSIIKC